jgi:hypothetical protein
MIDVHVYSELPRCLAVSLPATSSNTITQAELKNTIACGVKRHPAARGASAAAHTSFT